MDTKLMKIRYTSVFKTFVVLVTLVGMLMIGYGLLFYQDFETALSGAPYSENDMNRRSYQDIAHLLNTLAVDYRNEIYIAKGQTLTDEMRAEARLEINNAQNSELDQLDVAYDNWIYEATQVNNSVEVNRLKEEKKERTRQIMTKTDMAVADLDRTLIKKELQRYKDLKLELSKYADFKYHVSNGQGDTLANIQEIGDVKAYFETLPSAMEFREGQLLLKTQDGNTRGERFDSRLVGFVGQTKEAYALKESEFLYNRENGRWAVVGITVGFLLVLISVGIFIAVVGKSNKSSDVLLTFWDRPYLDVMTVIVVGLIITAVLGILYFYENVYPYDALGFYAFAGTFIVLGTLVGYYWLRLVTKRLKRKELFQRTLVFQILNWFFGGTVRGLRDIVEAVQKGSGSRRLVIEGTLYTLALAGGLISVLIFVRLFGFFGLLLAFGVLLFISVVAFRYRYKSVKSLEQIKIGVQKLADGDLNYRIDTHGFDTENGDFAKSVNATADGFLIAVEKEVKSERMKAELVTNVSHDLKTPLTSLIAYVDLLKKEDIPTEQGRAYLEVIDQKVERLRSLVEDLFEAAKASSGTLQVQAEIMDFAELLTQGLGETSEQIGGSGLDFRIQIAERPVYILADGKHLWRIVENLVSNILKYSLPQSRVYVQLQVIGEDVVLTTKNISAHELNMPAYELTERFKRGDEARNSEGSGLGLSIAKSLTELMRGKFAIEVDGDLFKATVSFKRENAPEPVVPIDVQGENIQVSEI